MKKLLTALLIFLFSLLFLQVFSQNINADNPTFKLGIMGDSNADEYQGTDNRGGAYHATTFNWNELLQRYKGADIGAWGSWPEPRRTGYEYNWAKSGARAQDLLGWGQAQGLAAQLSQQQFDLVFLEIGTNDFHFWNNTYQEIYNGTLSDEQVTQKVNNMLSSVTQAITLLRNASAQVPIVVATITNINNSPDVQANFPNASNRQRVSNAIAAYNAGLAALPQTLSGITIAQTSQVETWLFSQVDANGNITLEGESISVVVKGDEPHHLQLGDSVGHAGTVASGIYLKHLLIPVFNQVLLNPIPQITDTEILQFAGILPPTTPSPVPSVEPSPTPNPTPSVSPSPTPTVEPTPSPTIEPSPSATPVPSPTPEPTPQPTPTPEPTPTPTPTPVPSPTPDPTPDPSPSPTIEPSPTATPMPTSTPVPTLEPSPSPVPCTVTSAVWSTNSAIENDLVTLTVTTGGECIDKQVAFEVWENDSILEGAFDELAIVQPGPVVITNNQAVTTWTAERQNDCAGLCVPPEYYFNASVVGESGSMRSADPLLEVFPEPTPEPTPTPVPTATPTPVPTPTPTPTPVPTPTPTPTPSPSPSPSPTGGTVIKQIAASTDDVNQVNNTLTTNAATVWLGTGGSANSSFTGLRFSGVQIPQGATIQSAVLSVYSSQSQWLQIGVAIRAHAHSNSPTFSTASKPSQRPLTTASVSLSNNIQWNANTWYNLPDVKTVVSEVTNSPDWQTGNSLSFILKGTSGTWGRKFVSSFDGSSTLAPKLTITYTL